MAIRIDWDRDAFREIRTSDAIMSELVTRAGLIADAAGPGVQAEPAEITGGRGRGRVAVVTATPQAAAAEATNHTLLIALSAGHR